jgi:hypothetical protein
MVTIQNVNKDEKRLDHSYIADGNVKLHSPNSKVS